MKTIILNLKSRPDRLDKTIQELERVGLNDYEVFYAIEDKRPVTSFNLSMHEIMRQISLDFKPVLVV